MVMYRRGGRERERVGDREEVLVESAECGQPGVVRLGSRWCQEATAEAVQRSVARRGFIDDVDKRRSTESKRRARTIFGKEQEQARRVGSGGRVEGWR